MISEHGGLSALEQLSVWFDGKLGRIKETNCDICKKKMKSYQTVLEMPKRIICCSSECMRKASKDLSEKRDRERIGCVITLQEFLLIHRYVYFPDDCYPLDHPQRKALERIGFKEGIKLLSIRVLS